jgi:hypothetical protein
MYSVVQLKGLPLRRLEPTQSIWKPSSMHVLTLPGQLYVIVTVLALSRLTVIADSQCAFDEGREMKWKVGRR